MTRAIKRSPRIPEWEIPNHAAKCGCTCAIRSRASRRPGVLHGQQVFSGRRPQRQPRLARFSIEHFTDKVLDEGYWNRHWAPQIAQHKYFDEIYRFENIAETWPHEYCYRELGQWNKSKTPKPEIVYRLDELNEYYAEDLRAWEKATK